MMALLPGLSFGTPWVLALLAALPLLWRLLRVTPPGARHISFPAITLLFGLEGSREQAETTPPWLMALRLTLAALLILAAARPVLDGPPVTQGNGPLLLVIDDGWAAARDWPARREQWEQILDEAERAGQAALSLSTAPAADGGPIALGRLAPAAEARQALAGLEPKPWATERRAALAALKSLPFDKAGRVVWLSDGMGDDADAELARTLQGLGGGLELITGRGGRLLLPPEDESAAESLSPRLRRLPSPEAESVAIRGLDAKGTVLARAEARFAPAEATASASLILPVELRNRLVRLDIEGERGAGATLLLDERWRRHSVGLAGGDSGSSPLLERLYYLERALAPHADLKRGELADLLTEDQPPEVLILADQPLGAGATAAKALERVERGGVLIRFAGPLLAQSAGSGDPLLPVRLLGGGRALGGVLSWTTPMRLAPFPEMSPFAGLALPDDVQIRSQVLAEPGLELASHTWASLTDGTPLVTADRRGKGWVVLIHTSANAEWSNLPLSGLFVDMMRRLLALSNGGASAKAAGEALAPTRILDGFGRLGPAAGLAGTLERGGKPPQPGPRHPPGFYGPAESGIALNLGPAMANPRPLVPPPGARLTSLGAGRPAPDLVPALLVGALILALADMAATLALRGLLWRLGALIALAVAGGSARADSLALEAALTTRLACIATHDAAVDRTCLAGLRGLSAKLAERSTAELGEPLLVDPERDPVLFFPLLYWRITPGQPLPSARAVEKLNAYMARGGLIVLDTADEGQPGAGPDTAELNRLRDLARGLALPPLAPLESGHVLNRSFYLLKEVPGRWDGASLWVSQSIGATNDGVSPVVLGGNDWVGAWAVDDRGRPLNAVIPGGERQREMAYRFGINLVMYALTGNYKADQVHLPAIMDRLRR
ncbi:MAG: DUF4159 domain-containing protein [Magnetospirillum sp.]|nr:DUF4159 domain-containing protein [Magnetospirillum sp.]